MDRWVCASVMAVRSGRTWRVSRSMRSGSRGELELYRRQWDCAHPTGSVPTHAYRRLRRPRAISKLGSWSPCGVQTFKSLPVASTGVQNASR
jgi:hypothetical protein